jgi:integrase
LLEAASAIDEERRARAAGETTIANGTKGAGWRPTTDSIRIPQTPFLRALAFTGARFSELAATTWGDWDERTRMLTLRAETTKTKKTRRIPLVAAVEDDLRRLRDLHAVGYGRAPVSAEPIYLTSEGCEVLGNRENVLRFLHDAMARAGVPKVDPVRGRASLHSLRHTFCSMMSRANVPITQAQALMGHASVELTASRYCHHEDADLRAAVEKLRTA